MGDRLTLDQRPRLGVIGTGPWAGRLHVPAAEASGHVRLTAILGRDANRTETCAAGTTASAQTDLVRFLDLVDIVVFAVPPGVQAQLAPAVIDAGKQLLFEKPIALDPATALQLVERAEARGARTVVFLPHRLNPRLALWHREMREKGPWVFGEVESWSSVLVDSANIFHASPWRHERGALWDVGPHALAQLTAVLGRVREVSARRGPGDLTVMSLAHEDGAQSVAALAADRPDPAPRASPTAFIGDAGRVETPPVEDWDRFTSEAWNAAVEYLADDSGLASHATDLRFGAHLTDVLAAADRSLSSGRPQRV